MTENIDIKRIPLRAAFKFETEINFLVIPGCSVQFYLTAFFDKTFAIVTSGFESLIDSKGICSGDLVRIVMKDNEYQILSIKKLIPKETQDLVYTYRSGFKRTKLYKGQSMQIRGGRGKTKLVTIIADKFDKQNYLTQRLLVGQRKEETLGREFNMINSSYEQNHQIDMFLSFYHVVLRNVHQGVNCCFVIDAMDKFITLHGETESRLLPVMNQVRRLLQMSGDFSSGSLSIVFTNSRHDTNLSKSIDTQLRSFTDESILLH
jgi:hypothetical protein